MITNEKVKLCNCARCDCLLLGESMRPHLLRNRIPYEFKDVSLIAGRIKDRPYCYACLTITRKKDNYSRQQKLDRIDESLQ